MYDWSPLVLQVLHLRLSIRKGETSSQILLFLANTRLVTVIYVQFCDGLIIFNSIYFLNHKKTALLFSTLSISSSVSLVFVCDLSGYGNICSLNVNEFAQMWIWVWVLAYKKCSPFCSTLLIYYYIVWLLFSLPHPSSHKN